MTIVDRLVCYALDLFLETGVRATAVTPDQVITLVKILAELFGAVLWPLVVLVILHRFREPLSDFFSGLG